MRNFPLIIKMFLLLLLYVPSLSTYANKLSCDVITNIDNIRKPHVLFSTETYENMDVGLYINTQTTGYANKLDFYISRVVINKYKPLNKNKSSLCQSLFADLNASDVEHKTLRLSSFHSTTVNNYKQVLDQYVNIVHVKGCEEAASSLSDQYIAKMGAISNDAGFQAIKTVYYQCLKINRPLTSAEKKKKALVERKKWLQKQQLKNVSNIEDIIGD